jgi:hypothetical protein
MVRLGQGQVPKPQERRGSGQATAAYGLHSSRISHAVRNNTTTFLSPRGTLLAGKGQFSARKNHLPLLYGEEGIYT